MSRIVVLHARPDEGEDHATLLRRAGHEVRVLWPDGMPALGPVRRNPPDVFVIDLARQPSQGRALATALRQLKATRQVPLVFVEGDPEKTARVKAALPDATYATWRGIRGAVKRATSRPPAAPVVPATMAAYSAARLPKKLGIRAGSVVALLGAPRGFDGTLGELPEGVVLRRDARKSANVLLLFATSAAVLRKRFKTARRAIGEPGALWILWPKKASGVRSDLGGNQVRAFGLEAGLVDFKIAAVDATWSGLCFARRKPRL